MTAAAPGLDAQWLARLGRVLDRPATRPRVPLELAVADGRTAAIGSIEPELAGRIAAAGLPLRRLGDAWRIEAPRAATPPDPALAAIAHWLRAAGMASRWRDELLSVTDAAGDVVGAIERAAVRPLGIATHAVHLVLHDVHGHVWVQQRAFDKATDPGRWDTTVGGLVAAGETIAQTLARETWEEAGLRLEDIQSSAPFGRFTVRRPLVEGYMVEHIEMVEATLPGKRVPMNQDGEVERFECIDRATLVERLHADAFTVEAALILATWLRRAPAAAH